MVWSAEVLPKAKGVAAWTRLGRRGGDLLRRIHEQIDSQLHDPGLRTVHVAQALGVSARYVQQLLAGQGTTFSGISPPHPTDLATDAALEAPESETSSAMTIQQS